MASIYDFKALTNRGKEIQMSEYKGLKGKAAHAMLKRISKSVEKESDILWNFTKFLISKDGQSVQRFAPVAEPADFEAQVVAELGK